MWTLTYEAAPSNEAAASQRIERAVVLSGARAQKNEWHLIDVEDATEINDRIRKIETKDDHTFP